MAPEHAQHSRVGTRTTTSSMLYALGRSRSHEELGVATGRRGKTSLSRDVLSRQLERAGDRYWANVRYVMHISSKLLSPHVTLRGCCCVPATNAWFCWLLS